MCYNSVLSCSKRCGYMKCLLAIGAGSTLLAEVSATVTYDKTSGKQRVYTFSWFWTTWNISRRYCRSASLKLIYCFSRYNLANPLVPIALNLKAPYLHTYCSLPHMESHILGWHSAILFTCWSLSMMKVEPFNLRLRILQRVGSPDWDKILQRHICSCLRRWKRDVEVGLPSGRIADWCSRRRSYRC